MIYCNSRASVQVNNTDFSVFCAKGMFDHANFQHESADFYWTDGDIRASAKYPLPTQANADNIHLRNGSRTEDSHESGDDETRSMGPIRLSDGSGVVRTQSGEPRDAHSFIRSWRLSETSRHPTRSRLDLIKTTVWILLLIGSGIYTFAAGILVYLMAKILWHF